MPPRASARHFPDVKVIAFLRNPVDILASLYRLLRQRECRAPSFEEELRLRPHWLDLGFYHRLLLPYFECELGPNLVPVAGGLTTLFSVNNASAAATIAHVTFCIPFDYLPIAARLEGIEGSYEQAARDADSDASSDAA